MFGQTSITLNAPSGRGAEVDIPFLSIELLFKEN